MSLVHQNSCECVQSELDLFDTPPTQTSVEDGYWHQIGTVTSVNDGGPYVFDVSGAGDDYLDLANTSLYVKAQILNNDSTNLTDENVAPVNLWLHSLFGDVSVCLTEKLVSSPNNMYPFRAYLETLLSYGPAAKESQLTSGMWYKDTAVQMDTAGNDNHGYIKRKLSTATSRSVEMMGRLHSDLFAQERYLVNNVNMKITLTRSKDVFCLMGEDKEFKVVIKDIYLNVRKVRLSPSVRLAHAKALEISPAKYPIRRIAMKVFSVPRGNHNFVKDNLFLGQMPKRLVIGCVDSDAYSGLITKNPFHFKDFDINFVVLNVDGKQVPTKPLQPNFTQKHYVRSYMGLFNTTGKTFRDEGNNISKDEYGTGFTLFGFDLTPDLSEVGTFHLIKKGNLSLEVHFGTALPNTINVVVYAEFDNIIEIDRNRQILFDYSA
ncbi:uncharacterized protein F54H12.2-like [Pecten maximus]|uniref:uncharacterized protein F54H12.2-like n=1 Tax=Pecten maximus TaxID=6579 RepID=UPI0014585B09|nr:uncharacterized protein F54H12.2-like [Pecten maximus]